MSRSDEPKPLDGADQVPAFLLQKEGCSLGEYRLIKKVGEGSFGEVWKAEKGNVDVALKILKKSMDSDETQRELKSLAALRDLHHPFLLHTERSWTEGDRLFIEMELADGGTLKERLRTCKDAGRKGIPVDELLRYFSNVAEGLDYMHQRQPPFLHRDIKPANILLVRGAAKLADFGLLRQVAGDHTSTQTQGGTVVYMAPESIRSYEFSARSDIFSFAVTYAELRQGHLPFSGKTEFQIGEQIVRGTPDLDAIFLAEEKAVLLKALHKDKDDRFASCGEFLAALNQAVPWSPKITMQEIALPADNRPLSHADLPATDLTPHGHGEPGTARISAAATARETEMPPPDEPWAQTVRRAPAFKDDGTGSGRKGRPAPEPTLDASDRPGSSDRGTQGKVFSPSDTRAGARPQSKETIKLERLRKPARVPVALRVLLGLVAILVPGAAIWFIAHEGAHEEILALIKAKNFPKAKDQIDNVPGWLFLNRPQMRKLLADAEKEPVAAVTNPGKKDGPPKIDVPGNNKKIPIESALDATAMVKRIHGFLDNGNLKEAQDLFAKNKAGLGNQGDEVERRIENKKKVVGHLERAKRYFDNKNYADCRAEIKSLEAEPLTLDKKDSAKKDALTMQVDALTNQRDLAAQAGKLYKAEDYVELRKRLTDAGSYGQVELDSYAPRVLTELLGKAWKALLENNNVAECERRLQEINDFVNGPPATPIILNAFAKTADKDVQVLQALVRAHQASKSGAPDAVGLVIDFVAKDKAPSDRNKKTWTALAQLEKKKHLFSFDLLEALEKVAPTLPVKEVRQANSEILSSALQRWVKKSAPGDSERGLCVTWYDRIDNPNDWMRALNAECLLLETNNVPVDATDPFAKASWYGAYVHALAKEKKADPKVAAKILQESLADEPGALVPAERAANAARLCCAAVGKLERSSDKKGFKSALDAQNAARWLGLAFPWLKQAGKKPVLDDLITLAFAGAKNPDYASELAKVSQNLDNGDFENASPAAKVEGFYWLAKAYLTKGKSDKEVFAAFDKALAVEKPKAPWGKLAAEEGARCALRLAIAEQDKGKETRKFLESAIEKAVLCRKYARALKDLDLTMAAELYHNGVYVQFTATGQRFKWEKEDLLQVYADAIPEKLEPFYVPAIIEELTYALYDKVYFPVEHLGKAIKHGTQGVKLAEAAAKAPKSDKAFWETQQCACMVRLADVRQKALDLKSQEIRKVRGDKITPQDLDDLALESEGIVKLYEKAKGMEKYDSWLPPSKRWNELAFKIGICHLSLAYRQDTLKNVDETRKELNIAKMELEASQKNLKMAPEGTQESIRVALSDIKMLLEKLSAQK